MADSPSTDVGSKLLLTVKQAAAYSGLSEKRIRQLVNSGNLRSTRFGAGKTATIYIHRHALEEYIDSLPPEELIVRTPKRRSGSA